jgi:glycerophosphoryl diester phosphodiesterase
VLFVTRLYAHRGAAAERPENTLDSFARALELGAGALEFDVHATRDGVLVVSHDPDTLRMTGVAAELRRTDWADVRRFDAGWGFRAPDGSRPFAGRGLTMPRLEEVLEAFPAVELNIDLKAPVADVAVALLRRLRAEARVCVASFQSATLRRVRALGYAGPTSLGTGEVAWLLALPASLLRRPFALPAALLRGAIALPAAPPRGAVRAQLPHQLGRRWIVERCRALGLAVDYWTVNDAAMARRLLALGVDGIMTDDPARIGPVVRA